MSENRPDLLTIVEGTANDPIQKVLQRTMGSYGVGYERKAGEDLPVRLGHKSILSKEDAAAAYIGIIEGTPSKLRNSLSRRELNFQIRHLPSLYITLVMLGFPTLILANGLLDKLKKPSSVESAPRKPGIGKSSES